ncbi:MAG: DUF4091 domain-containing protein [Opitutaceae bacterium]
MIKQRPATERFFLAIMLSTLSILLALPSLAVVEAAPAQLRVGLIDEVQELYPDTVLVEPVRQLTVHTARNTLAGVSIMITGLSGSPRIQFGESSPDGSATPGLRWLRMIDVPVLENTGLDRNTEKYSGKINPYVIRRAPFRVYDPLEPVHSPLTVSSSSLALRVEVPITATMAAGTYRHQLKLTIGAQVEVLELTVVVHAALVPPVNQATLAYINWHSIDNICSAHGVEKWSEPFWAMLAQYAQLMAHGRQNAFWFNWADYFTIDANGEVVEFRRDRLERYLRVFLDAGLTTIHGAPMFGRRNWTSTDMLLYVPTAGGQEVVAVSPKGQRMLTQMAERIVAMMAANHWAGAWVQGVFDEPEDPFVERYRVLIALLRAVKPDIKILEATMTLNVSGLVNIWCPQVQEYQAHQDFFRKRQAAGDQVWVYTCLSPGGPWLNRLLDQERLRQVYLGWACAKYDLQGFLHWGGNFHTAKPFEELVRFHMEGQFLPAGDSHIFYPLPAGPLASHRFEAHRIGLEDYELLTQLKRRDRGRAEAIIAEVLQSFDQYRKDSVAYRTARQHLLEALDGLKRP